jgi:hypothetical protein
MKTPSVPRANKMSLSASKQMSFSDSLVEQDLFFRPLAGVWIML